VVKVPRADDVPSAPPGASEPGPTVFLIRGPLEVPEVPTVSAQGMALLAALLAAGALAFLRR
jgi:hypothetical protein